MATKTTLETRANHEEFPRGTVIFKEREHATCAYVIEHGRVEITTDVSGERRVLATMGPGEMFGEMAVLDGTVRSGTATTVADTRLTLIHEEQLRSRLESAEPILKLLLRVILNRFRHEQSLFRRPGGDVYEVIDASVDQETAGAIDKMKLESELRGALDRDELTLHYQPIISLDSGKTEGFEALLRWRHHELGRISPQQFIGLAEETALIVPIGRFVLEKACLDLIELSNRADRPLTMNVNVSGRQFAEPSFIGELAGIIKDTAIDPNQLKLEITEGVLMDYRSAPLRWVEQCKRLGTRIALDDFGTGFSSLSYLASFPIDTLKIDRSFVNAMGKDPRSLKIVRAINQLAHGIGVDVVAEGIETEEQRDELARMGCELGQGFWFSRAVRLEKALEYLER